MAARVTLALALAIGSLAATAALPGGLSGAPQYSALSVQSHPSAVLLGRTDLHPAASRRYAGTPALTLGEPARVLGEGEAFLSSLLVPGLAQYRQGQRRWIAYAGLEVLSAVLYLGARADALGLRADYRDFAWSAARSGLSTAPRRDGDFEYYERLTQWATSGRWDADPALDGVQPEGDPSTYNGSVWTLAMQIFNLDPTAPQRSPPLRPGAGLLPGQRLRSALPVGVARGHRGPAPFRGPDLEERHPLQGRQARPRGAGGEPCLQLPRRVHHGSPPRPAGRRGRRTDVLRNSALTHAAGVHLRVSLPYVSEG